MRSHPLVLVVGLLLFLATTLTAQEKQDPKPPKEKMVGGNSEILRDLPKRFATLVSVEVAQRQVTLKLESDRELTTWTLTPDVEIKYRGWWGRLEQFAPKDRVWAWFELDRHRKPRRILMLADELSQLDIHGTAWTLETADLKGLSLKMKPPKGEIRTFKMADAVAIELGHTSAILEGNNGGTDALFDTSFKPGDKYLVQSAGDRVRVVANIAGLDKLRDKQKEWLRERWLKDGLPGTVAWLHPLSGELELMLDHEAMRWGRSLKNGDKVTINVPERINADVKDVRPWRERTTVRLVASGFQQADLTLGQRVGLLVHKPAPEVDTAELPPDIGRPRSKAERCDWFLASIYCSCAVANETCTGMFYTLASCNVNACGMPIYVRDQVAELIDKGMTDEQIWAVLKKEQGPLMLKQHLLP